MIIAHFNTSKTQNLSFSKAKNAKSQNMKMNKKGNITIIFIAIIVLLVIFTSTQKVVINNKQVVTAIGVTCNAVGYAYDPINKVCIPEQNVNNSNAP